MQKLHKNRCSNAHFYVHKYKDLIIDKTSIMTFIMTKFVLMN